MKRYIVQVKDRKGHWQFMTEFSGDRNGLNQALAFNRTLLSLGNRSRVIGHTTKALVCRVIAWALMVLSYLTAVALVYFITDDSINTSATMALVIVAVACGVFSLLILSQVVDDLDQYRSYGRN